MYERISWVKFWLLSVITCGIYAIVVWYKMGKGLNQMGEAYGEAPINNYIVAMLLGCVTCGIYPLIWLFKFFGLMSRLNNNMNAGVTPDGTFIMFIMSLIPVYSFYWLADAYNKLADAAEK